MEIFWLIIYHSYVIFQDLIPEHCDQAKDRICILVCVDGEDYVLGAPGIDSGTGLNQFHAIIKIIKQYDIADYIFSIVFDTTASNTGKLKGAIYR